MDRRAFATLGLILAAATALTLAPLPLDASYDWMQHTLSQAGGQGVSGAWLTRAGFILFGLAVAACMSCARWRSLTTAFFGWFALSMVGVAAFSLESWDETLAYDRTESWLHSFFATTMGFAFAFGVTSRWYTRRRMTLRDPLAVVASVALPMLMVNFDDLDGFFQRIMFAIALAWFAAEAISAGRQVVDGHGDTGRDQGALDDRLDLAPLAPGDAGADPGHVHRRADR